MGRKYLSILVVIVIVVVLLNIYLFQRYQSLTQNQTPSSSVTVQQTLPSDSDKIKNYNEIIDIVSDIDTINIESIDKQKLGDILNEVNFFDRSSVTYYKPSGLQVKSVTANSLKIHLTDKLQPLGHITSKLPDGSTYTYQSFGVFYQPSENSSTDTYDIDLYLHVDSEIIQDEDSQKLSTRFISGLLSTSWNLTHPMKSSYSSVKERLVGIDEYIKKYLSNAMSYLTLKKT